MKKILLVLLFNMCVAAVWAQQAKPDSIEIGTVIINKDPRIEVLGRKMAEYNESLSTKLHSTKGYRLMVLNTNDRTQAMQVRSQLLQMFPEQSVYMIFQSPYIKLKFGNFVDKGEADDFRKQIVSSRIVTGNIYILPEMVEVKGEKLLQTED